MTRRKAMALGAVGVLAGCTDDLVKSGDGLITETIREVDLPGVLRELWVAERVADLPSPTDASVGITLEGIAVAVEDQPAEATGTVVTNLSSVQVGRSPDALAPPETFPAVQHTTESGTRIDFRVSSIDDDEPLHGNVDAVQAVPARSDLPTQSGRGAGYTTADGTFLEGV